MTIANSPSQMNEGIQQAARKSRGPARIRTAAAALAFAAATANAAAMQSQSPVSDPDAVMRLEWEIGPWDTLWKTANFESRIVGEKVGYYLYLPPGYDSDAGRRYPILLWLHGAYGRPHEASPIIARLDKAIRNGAAPPMIVVSALDPTGLGMWTDSKNGRLPMESLIIKELIPHIDKSYRTLATAKGRAIEGFSMGGYGAAYLGFKYPDLFSSVSMLAAALHRPETLKERRAAIFANVFGDDLDYARARSPWLWAQKNAEQIRKKQRVRLYVGAEDALLEWDQEFHILMAKRKIAHEWGVVPNSAHDIGALMRNWEGDYFEFYRDAFGMQAGVTPTGERKK